jgi:hypothetical protein
MYVSRKKNFTSKEVDEKHLYMKNSSTSKVLDVGKVILKMTCENLLTLTMYFITPDIVMTLKKKQISIIFFFDGKRFNLTEKQGIRKSIYAQFYIHCTSFMYLMS